jgi:hypothetical protein
MLNRQDNINRITDVFEDYPYSFHEYSLLDIDFTDVSDDDLNSIAHALTIFEEVYEKIDSFLAQAKYK